MSNQSLFVYLGMVRSKQAGLTMMEYGISRKSMSSHILTLCLRYNDFMSQELSSIFRGNNLFLASGVFIFDSKRKKQIYRRKLLRRGRLTKQSQYRYKFFIFSDPRDFYSIYSKLCYIRKNSIRGLCHYNNKYHVIRMASCSGLAMRRRVARSFNDKLNDRPRLSNSL